MILFLFNFLFNLMAQSNADSGEDFIWGTEGHVFISDYSSIPVEKKNIVNQINDVLGIKYVKMRILLPMNNDLSSDMCIQRNAYYTAADPACRDPQAIRFSFDETAKLFKENAWSMIPMFSHASAPRQDIPINRNHIERFVDFVDWFVEKYGKLCNIKLIELVNAPYHTWNGTERQLLELQNKTYERIKNKYPDLKIGTPGFEYYRDTKEKIRGTDQHRFRNYFLENDAKFDFWAFHGYPTLGDLNRFDYYPPTKKAKYDKYSGIDGIIELRKTLDRKGWQGREIIDMENTGVLGNGSLFNMDDDKLDAAYMVQQLVLKRSLKVNGKRVLSGIISQKILPRCERPPRDQVPERKPPRPRRGAFNPRDRSPQNMNPPDINQPSMWSGECAWGSLYPDGSTTISVKAVGMLISNLSNLVHVARVSGEFDDDNTVWIEKFKGKSRELYICFKPFAYRQGQRPELGVSTIPYRINFSNMPSNVDILDIYGNKTKVAPAMVIQHSVGNAPQFVIAQF